MFLLPQLKNTLHYLYGKAARDIFLRLGWNGMDFGQIPPFKSHTLQHMGDYYSGKDVRSKPSIRPPTHPDTWHARINCEQLFLRKSHVLSVTQAAHEFGEAADVALESPCPPIHPQIWQ